MNSNNIFEDPDQVAQARELNPNSYERMDNYGRAVTARPPTYIEQVLSSYELQLSNAQPVTAEELNPSDCPEIDLYKQRSI